MAKNIVISGETYSGKTMIALALAAKLRDEGKAVGYFKPVGKKSYEHSQKALDVDEDAAVMKQVLELKANLACICPIVRTQSSYDEFLQIGQEALLSKLMDCYNEISDGMDFMIIEGAKLPWHLLHVQLSTPQIAKHLDAMVLCIVNFQDITAIDDIFLQRDIFKLHGIQELGIILNMVPPMLKNTVIEKIKPFVEKQGLRFCGVVYQSRELFSPTVREILKELDGELLYGEEHLDRLVDQFLIGAMTPDNALKWFRRAKNLGVITSGDRADICLAALETDTNLLILTGGMGPDIRTISRAKEVQVPIMMTAHDTYTTAQIVNGLVGTVTPENKGKIELIKKTIGGALNLICVDNA
jgi:BioD-like phosphotransacetylase family protein